MLIVPLHSNGSYWIVACVFVAAGIYLTSRCLAMNIYSDFTVPALWRHVTIGISFIQHVPHLISIRHKYFPGHAVLCLLQVEPTCKIVPTEVGAPANLQFITPVPIYSVLYRNYV
jgi:hypothetical protein